MRTQPNLKKLGIGLAFLTVLGTSVSDADPGPRSLLRTRKSEICASFSPRADRAPLIGPARIEFVIANRDGTKKRIQTKLNFRSGSFRACGTHQIGENDPFTIDLATANTQAEDTIIKMDHRKYSQYFAIPASSILSISSGSNNTYEVVAEFNTDELTSEVNRRKSNAFDTQLPMVMEKTGSNGGAGLSLKEEMMQNQRMDKGPVEYPGSPGRRKDDPARESLSGETH